MLGVPLNGDRKVVPIEAHIFIGEGLVGQLVHRVGSIGDDLPEENFLVGINGVDHQVQQPFGLCPKLLLFHIRHILMMNLIRVSTPSLRVLTLIIA